MKQGDLALLRDPVAQSLLASRISARLAYSWLDGAPRVVPIWFHWNGSELVLATAERAPKLKALRENPQVALTIDDDSTWPYRVLMVRGVASVNMVDGLPEEFVAAAYRYLGDEGGEAFLKGYASVISRMGRIAVRPEWVGVIDFETRLPSAVSG
jgi:Pyridoxamine 5'-phosphate oxidase